MRRTYPPRRSSFLTFERLVLFLLFGIVAIAAAGFGVWRWRVREANRRDDAARFERAERARLQVPVARVAVGPVPTELPLEGPEGVDPDGYPKRYVARAALRSLLMNARYTELTTYLERFQTEFESDPRKEYWPLDAADAFDSTEPELDAKLDAWVAATPTSFAPYLARGTHLTAVGFTARGTHWLKDTPKSNLTAMVEAFRPALRDLDRSIELRPKLLAAMRRKLQIRAAGGLGPKTVTTLESATMICPSCFRIRVVYMVNSTPRWGGSHAEMLRVARSAPVESNPRLRLLPGYVDVDIADTAKDETKKDEALAAIERACALGEHWEFLLERARIRSRREELDRAVADLDRALELRPEHPDVLILRARVRAKREDWEGAGTDLLGGLRVDPTDADARTLLPTVVQGLVYVAWKRDQEGRRGDALRLLDLAAELAPLDSEVQQRRAAIVTGATAATGAGGSADIAKLEANALAAPDDFRAQQALDYALARQGKFDRVVTLWTTYLSRHPEDGRAYLERGGAYHHLGRTAEAHADATRACDLGVSEGCAQARRFPAAR